MALDALLLNKGRDLLNGFLYFYIGLFVFILVLGLCFPIAVARYASLFPTAQLVAQRSLIVWGIVLFGLQIITYYLTSILEMYRRFTAALFSPLNALLPLICLGIWGKQVGIITLVYGFVAANVLQIIVFFWALKKELKWKFTQGLLFPSRVFIHNLLSNQLMELVNIINGWLPLYLLSGLAAGLVSAVNYAKQLTESATEVFSLRVTNVAKIELTEHFAHQRANAFNETYLTTHRLLCIFLTPLCVFSVFYAPEIITIFFKRGIFNTQNVYQASSFLRPLLGVMLLMVPVLMQNNAVAAARKLKDFLPYALSSMLLFIAIVPLTMRWWGPFAFPYTQVVCILIGLGINSVFFKRYIPDVAIGKSLWQLVRLLAYNVAALLPTALFTKYISGTNPWIMIGTGGPVFLAVLWGCFYYSGDLQWLKNHFNPRAPLP